MDSNIITYIWCVEYYQKYQWDYGKVSKYFRSEEAANVFVDNYENICRGDFGPVKWMGNARVIPIVKKQLALHVDEQIYVVGSPVTLEG